MTNNRCYTISGTELNANGQITLHGFDRIYIIGSMIRSGGYGTVYSGHRKKDGMQVAIKRILKAQVPMVKVFVQDNNKIENYANEEHAYTNIPLEVYFMRNTNHISGVIKLIEFYELPDWYYLIMERVGSSVSGCTDFFHFITNNGPLKEELAKKIFKQIVEAVNSCHKSGIFHRDIKDENILIDEKHNQIKLIDFGSGDKYHEGIYTEYSGMYKL